MGKGLNRCQHRLEADFARTRREKGPFDHDRAVARARRNPDGFAWRAGFADWMPISKIAELSQPAEFVPMPPPVAARGKVDEIDFKIIGAEMQFVEVELDPGESAVAEPGGIKTALFGGEGFFFATLRGPGQIWLQSLPFSRLAGRMLQTAPQRGGSKGEGSILGALGGLLDGDNR